MVLLPVGTLDAASPNLFIGCADGDVQFLTVQLTGTWSGTVAYAGTLNDSNFASIRATRLATGSAGTGFTVNGQFRMDVTGLSQVRLRFNPATSGTVEVAAALSKEG